MDINKIIELFDSQETENKYLLDHYPYRISDNNKYKQIECYYRKFNAGRKQYYNQEKGIIRFLTYLWLYSDMEVLFFSSAPKMVNLYLDKKLKFYNKNQRNFLYIERKKQLDFIGKLMCRDYGCGYIVCKKFLNQEDLLLYCSECTAIILINNNAVKDEIEKIASNCGLFLRKQ